MTDENTSFPVHKETKEEKVDITEKPKVETLDEKIARLEEIREGIQEEKAKLDADKALSDLGGQTSSEPQQPVKEETAKEYADKVMEGKIK